MTNQQIEKLEQMEDLLKKKELKIKKIVDCEERSKETDDELVVLQNEVKIINEALTVYCDELDKLASELCKISRRKWSRPFFKTKSVCSPSGQTLYTVAN